MLDLLEVEIEFLTLEDVTIATTRLTRTRGNDGKETTSGELIINMRLNLGFILAGSKLTKNTVRLLNFSLLTSLNLALSKGLTIMGLVPLTEGSSINLDNGTLYESLGTDELVVASIVDDIDNTGLTADGFRSPGEVTRIETEGTILDVTSTDTDGMDTLGTELGVSRLTAELELSLLTVEGTFGTSGRSLMAAVSANT